MTQSIQVNATLPLGQMPNADATQTIVGGTQPHNGPPLRTLKVTKKSPFPTGVATNVKQPVWVVRDKSSSMTGNKILELNLACHAFLAELADPVNKDGFLVSVIDFNQKASSVISLEPATTLIMPDAIAGGSTNFDAPLNMVTNEIEAFRNRQNVEGWHYLRGHVLFLSDGWAPVTEKNIQALHELADVTAIAYGSDADQATLSRISSDRQVHAVGTQGGDLRDFLEQVGKTMTQGFVQAM